MWKALENAPEVKELRRRVFGKQVTYFKGAKPAYRSTLGTDGKLTWEVWSDDTAGRDGSVEATDKPTGRKGAGSTAAA